LQEHGDEDNYRHDHPVAKFYKSNKIFEEFLGHVVLDEDGGVKVKALGKVVFGSYGEYTKED
jgi:hypothetical protein